MTSRLPRRPAPARTRGRRVLFALPLLIAAPSAAQAPTREASVRVSAGPAQVVPTANAARTPVPWAVGEKAHYEVRFGKLKVGSGSIEVVQLDNVRGREAWHTRFRVTGGTFFYRVNDVLESWFDSRTLASLRFVKDQEEGRSDREARYEIYPERTVFHEKDGAEQPSVAQPLDDGSFLFFVRTIPLEVGETYAFNRYFKPDRNPVTIRVLRRERVRVPAGEFPAIVVQPVFKTKGIFSDKGRAEVWLSDDDRRIVLQMKSQLSFGSLNLYLKSHQPGGATSSR